MILYFHREIFKSYFSQIHMKKIGYNLCVYVIEYSKFERYPLIVALSMTS